MISKNDGMVNYIQLEIRVKGSTIRIIQNTGSWDNSVLISADGS